MNCFGIELVLCDLYLTRFELTKDLLFDTQTRLKIHIKLFDGGTVNILYSWTFLEGRTGQGRVRLG